MFFWISTAICLLSIFYSGLLFWLEKSGGFWFLLLGVISGCGSAAFYLLEDRHEKK